MVSLKNEDADFIAKLVREFIKDLEEGFADYQKSTGKALEAVKKLAEVLDISKNDEVVSEQKKLAEHIQKQYDWYEAKKQRLEKALLLLMGGSDAQETV